MQCDDVSYCAVGITDARHALKSANEDDGVLRESASTDELTKPNHITLVEYDRFGTVGRPERRRDSGGTA